MVRMIAVEFLIFEQLGIKLASPGIMDHTLSSKYVSGRSNASAKRRKSNFPTPIPARLIPKLVSRPRGLDLPNDALVVNIGLAKASGLRGPLPRFRDSFIVYVFLIIRLENSFF